MSCQSVKVEKSQSGHSQLSLRQPLSLEQSSFNCIIINIDKYPPDLLALLPLHFRRELLLLLPPADIFQLEQTKAVEGIDMENEIWKAVNEHYNYEIVRRAHCENNDSLHHSIELPQLGLSSSSSLQSDAWKDQFASCLVSFLLYSAPIKLTTDHAEMCDVYANHCGHRNYMIFLQLLFCTQFYKLKQLTDVGGFPLQVSEVTLLPSRYSRFFTSLVPLSEWVRFLLEDCHIEPPNTIKIDLHQFNVETGRLLQQILTNVKAMKLFMKCVCRETSDRMFSLLPSVNTEAVRLLDKVTQLCTILLPPDKLECVNIYQIVGDVRNTIDQRQLNKVLRKCFLKDHSSQRFQVLKCIDITSYKTEIDLTTLFSLFSFTQNDGFESISICGLTVMFLQTLRHSAFTSFKLISSTCSLIHLRDVEHIPFSVLFWLMKLFLFSPSTIAQKMVVSTCDIEYSENKHLTMASIPKAKDLADSQKSLHLIKLTLERAFVEALTCLPILVLDTLYIDHSPRGYYHYFASTDVLCSLLRTLPTIPTCHIKSLSVQFIQYNDLKSCVNLDPTYFGTIIQLAQQLPDTAVSFHCSVVSRYVTVLIATLHSVWMKNDGKVPLNQLHIKVSDSFAKIPDFQSSLEKQLMIYPINDMAARVSIKRNGSSLSLIEVNNLKH